MRSVGLLLSLALVILASYKGIALTMSMEKPSQKSIEYGFEKKQSEKLLDATILLSSATGRILQKDKSINVLHNAFDLLAPTSTLFRPPISI